MNQRIVMAPSRSVAPGGSKAVVEKVSVAPRGSRAAVEKSYCNAERVRGNGHR